jgi:hypothetical protein
MSVQDQIKVFTDYLVQNQIQVNTIWLDIEKEDSACRSWMRNSQGNFGLAQLWVAEVRKDMQSGRKWGIYAGNSGWAGCVSKCPRKYKETNNSYLFIYTFSFLGAKLTSPHRWANIFGSNDVHIAPDLPLWVRQSDLDPRLEIYSPQIGGWDFATAKQWNTSGPDAPIAVEGCGGSVDFDTFAYQMDFQIPAHHLGPQSCKTTVDGLRYRTCANTSASCVVIGEYPIGTMVGLSCQVVGERIVGDWTTRYAMNDLGKVNDCHG